MLVETEIDWRSPFDAFAPFAGRRGAILFSSGAAADNARWSFFGAHPTHSIEAAGGSLCAGNETGDGAPFKALSTAHAARRRRARPSSGAPFVSGLIGFAGYECVNYVEPSVEGPGSPYRLPDFHFAAYDAVAAFDHAARRAFVVGVSEKDVERLRSEIGNRAKIAPPMPAVLSVASNFTAAAYRAAVSDVCDRIRRGDLFQANISQRLEAIAAEDFDAFGVFCEISKSSSAPFGAFMNFGAAKIMSFSPERFFAVRDSGGGHDKITAEPIKGTRPRGASPEEDAEMLAGLVADPKERAENIMIADLMRNDLSRICLDGAIREEAICEPVTHATVHHLVSRISGLLRKDINAADALGALFPCGSVTGAPKIEAMKTIADIEGAGRGPYCGAIGYIDDSGAADFSVGIRIAVAEGRTLSIPVGGGVTLRSDPEAEYDETIAKAQQFLRHLKVVPARQ
jgi:para-aminobenzoate synthetase component 1